MATTAQQALDLAIQRSALNNPDLVPPAQAVRWLANFERGVYLLAAKQNPEYFGKSGDTGTRSAYTDSWAYTTTPGDVASIVSAEVKTIAGTVSGVSVGDAVNLVSRRWPQLDLAPRAYILAGNIHGYGTELGAADANMVTVLTLYYAELPAGPTALGNNMSLEDQWIDMVVLPLARVLAIRDGRGRDEVESINNEYDMLKAAFLEHVGVRDGGAVRPLASVPVATALDSARR